MVKPGSDYPSCAGYRICGESNELTEVMRKPVKESDIVWDTVDLLMPGAQLTV